MSADGTLQIAETLRRECIDPVLRCKSVQMLASFSNMLELDAMEVERAAATVERYDTRMYLEHMRRLAFNLACNTALHSVAPDHLVHMSDEDLASGTIVQRIQEEEQERMRSYSELLKEKYDNVLKAQSSETMLRCRKCGSSDISWNQKQTRGADEASTVFCSCLKCKKRWRLS